jgi:membrane glycosyltransferase
MLAQEGPKLLEPVEPEQSTLEFVAFVQGTSELVEPEQSTSELVEPERSTSELVEPERSTSELVEDEQRTPEPIPKRQKLEKSKVSTPFSSPCKIISFIAILEHCSLGKRRIELYVITINKCFVWFCLFVFFFLFLFVLCLVLVLFLFLLFLLLFLLFFFSLLGFFTLIVTCPKPLIDYISGLLVRYRVFSFLLMRLKVHLEH